MNAEVFAEWHRRRGISVRRTESTYWGSYGGGVQQALPYHWVIDPTADELRAALHGGRTTALRYSAPASRGAGVMAYHVVFTGPSYELADLPHQARTNVKRGLRSASVERIPLDRLATEGWSLRHDTLARQGRVDAESQEWWVRLCRTADELPGFEAWAAVGAAGMTASVLAFTCDRCVCLLYLQSATDHLRERPNNALFFEVTKEMVGRPGIEEVFAGLRSLDAPESVDEFKFRMNYDARLVREKIVFRPLLKPLASRPVLRAAHRVNLRRSDLPRVRKFEGMVRGAVEGRLPIEQQSLPSVVSAVLELSPTGEGAAGEVSS